MEGVLEEPLPPDDLRCKRTDGRDWRCKRRIVDGKSFCLSHLYRGQKQRPPSSSSAPTSTPNPKPEPEPEPKPKPRVRIRLRVKPEPSDEFDFNPPPDAVPPPACPLPDHLRCIRNDGRSWRCKKQCLEGQTLCEFHFDKAKAQNQRRPIVRKKEDKGKVVIEKEMEIEEENGIQEREDFPVPENLRCGRNNGKDWRCKKRVVEGHSLCENHLEKRGNYRVKVNKRQKKDNAGGFVEVPEDLLCTRNDGLGWRCNRKVMEGKNLCEVHLSEVKISDLVGGGKKNEIKKRKKKTKNVNEPGNSQVLIKEEIVEEEEVVEKEKVNSKPVSMVVATAAAAAATSVEEDELRCKRTDGRGWRCKRRVLDGKTLCEIHYEQGRLRQKRITVPEELKIQRGEGGEKAQKSLKRKRELEILENNSDKGMKKMRAELIRVFLRREIIENNKKSEKQNGDSAEVTRDLPYGSMAIPPAPPTQILDNAGSLGIKIGAQCSNTLVTRRFRSKNIEPPPIGSIKIVPYPGNVEKVRSSGRKKCHWCRKCDDLCLSKCSSCKKRYFCSNCINERSADPEEVKLRCPVCCGSCDCKACFAPRSKDMGSKEVLMEKFKGSKFQHLQYLINFLLPILVQINQEQSVEVEKEAKFKGQNPSDIEIRQADVGCRDQCCCNNCKSPILDFHRSCPNCSYNLCLSCCREYSQDGSPGGADPCKMNTLIACRKKSSEKSVDLASVSLQDSTASLCISCLPMELGGCDNSLLDLRCIFPLNWTKELEISAKETASEHDFLQITDDSVHCSMCTSINKAGDKSKELQEVSRRKESFDNFLYCPSTSDDANCLLAHFQKHWRKGHPVKVCNVLQCSSVLSWDPLAMFCSYLEQGVSNCKNMEDANEAARCPGSYDVEFGSKESFTGSIQKGIHIRRETLTIKAKFSTSFTRKILEGHYNEIIHALPLQEYTNSRTGLLNIAGKLPEDFPDSRLGPHVCISSGSREEVARGEVVTKLCCNSYDEVNILVHVGDSPCSTEQINKVKKLIKINSNMTDQAGQASDKNIDDDETRLHSEVSVEAGERLGVAGASCCSAATNNVSVVNNHGVDKPLAAKLVNSSDTDSDASMICSRASHSPEKAVDQSSHQDHLHSLNVIDKQPSPEPCGAQWDVFRRQDIPKLLEYITKHIDEISLGNGLSSNVVHPIFDGSLYLDAVNKMQLKQEFDIEPWTFNQCLGEAVLLPAGCPYQIRNVKSCVNIATGFISPENALESIKLINDMRVLPNNHKAKQIKLEVEKMTICSIDEAIKEIYRLKSEEGSR